MPNDKTLETLSMCGDSGGTCHVTPNPKKQTINVEIELDFDVDEPNDSGRSYSLASSGGLQGLGFKGPHGFPIKLGINCNEIIPKKKRA